MFMASVLVVLSTRDVWAVKMGVTLVRGSVRCLHISSAMIYVLLSLLFPSSL